MGTQGQARGVQVIDLGHPVSFEDFEADVSALLRVRAYGRVSWSELDAKGVEQEYIIDDWMTAGDKSMLAGASGSGKSFCAIDQGLAIALGKPWLGNQTKQGLVIYQAGEGGRGVKNRLRAYRAHHSIDRNARVPFELLTARIDVYAADGNGGDTAKFIEAVKAIAAEWPDQQLRAVYIDTFATAQGAADEISGKDMAIVLTNIDRIAKATGAHVCLVHHMNADGKKIRGHTSLHANVDQVFLVAKNEQTGVRTITLSKIKDGEDGLRLQFELMSLQVGERDDGKRITSCICLPIGEKEAIRKEETLKGFALNRYEEVLMRAFFATEARYGQPVPEDMQIPSGVRSVVKWEQVLAAYADANPIDQDMTGLSDEEADKVRSRHKAMHTKRVTRCREYLTSVGVLGVEKPWAWFTGRPLRAFPRTQPKPAPEPENQTFAGDLGDTSFTL